MKKELFNTIEKARNIYISFNNELMTGYITAPADYSYDSDADILTLGTEESGIMIREFSKFNMDYDEVYDDFSIEKDGMEFVVNF